MVLQVNNAGITRDTLLMKMSPQQWQVGCFGREGQLHAIFSKAARCPLHCKLSQPPPLVLRRK